MLVLGSVISDILSCLYVFIAYKLEKREIKYLSNIQGNTKGLIKRLFKISIPMATRSYLMSAFSTVQMILIPLSLVRFGMSESEAISAYVELWEWFFP